MEPVTPSPEAQCERNIRAWLATYPIPLLLVKAEADRCWFERTPAAEAAIRNLALRLVLEESFAKNHGGDVVVGYREAVGNGAAQIIIHEKVIEFDFDHWRPWDVVGIFGHLGEILSNQLGKKKTDPFAVAKRLEKRGIHGGLEPENHDAAG